MKLMWLGYLVYSLGDCDMKLYIETTALFSSKNFCKIGIAALSFVFDKYCPIMN